ncbi:MAG: MCE family protein [Planctomycetaceae bacterium]|nr:MCE family protein [Planctomycetaceae bacterium]
MTASQPAESVPDPQQNPGESAEAATDSLHSEAAESNTIPMAEVREVAAVGSILTHSRLWWLTLGCVILAAWLVWKAQPQIGPQITIRFPEGHGLKAGDAVRFRGIEVGMVTSVELSEDLAGITVHVTLNPGAGQINNVGSRFWIVRPRFSLTEISGLETAVGAKYIAVSPGEPGSGHRNHFDGLVTAPPDELSAGGPELILRGDERFGISPGSVITWRGVTVGQVLSVNLSPDARHVDFGVRIDRAYRRLIRSSSRFWVNSGVHLDVGLTGVKLDTQSLQSILQGGIALITPANDDVSEVENGRVFKLAKSPQKEWLESAATVPFVDVPLPETVVVTGTLQTSLLGIRRERPFLQQGVLVQQANEILLLTPVLPTIASEGDRPAVLVEFRIRQPDGTESSHSGIPLAACRTGSEHVILVPLENLRPGTSTYACRRAQPEDCLTVRSAITEGRTTPVIQAIDSEDLEVRDNVWIISRSDTDFSQWHGAPVVAVSDGNIIGTLISNDTGTFVCPCHDQPAEP